MTVRELEEQILERMRKIDGCEKVLSVTVQPNGDDWIVYSFNRGPATEEDCHRALADVVPELKLRYTLSL